MTLLLVGLGVLGGLLIASLALNMMLWYTRREYVADWRRRTREAEDAKHAAEIRSAQQIDAMLERISTAPRLEVAPGRSTAELQEKTYISDEPYMDDAWNDFRGVPEDESE